MTSIYYFQSLSELDLSRCYFHGKVNYKMLPELYRKADLQLHLSIYDIINVVVEGLASGLPVITPSESGAADLLGKKIQLGLLQKT